MRFLGKRVDYRYILGNGWGARAGGGGIPDLVHKLRVRIGQDKDFI